MTELSKGDLVECVKSRPGARRQIGWQGKIVAVDWDVEGGCVSQYDVEWHGQGHSWVPPQDVALLPTKECQGCGRIMPESDFAGDYLCFDCRIDSPNPS